MKTNKIEKPLVSIICDVYNHGPYLEQCLDGFIMQETNFPIEILIHDDASSDNSQEIIKEYYQKFPDIIKPILQKENQYSKGVGIWKTYQFPRVKGKYIAICEGDDYWTDPLKLQKQVDYLEKNPMCGLVYSKAQRFYQDTSEFGDYWGSEQNYSNLLFNYSKIPSLTCMCRASLSKDYFNSIKSDPTWPIGDVPLWLYFFYKSKVHFIDESFGVYRILENSMCHIKDLHKNTTFFDRSFQCRAYYAEKYWGKELGEKVQKQRITQLLEKIIWEDTGDYNIESNELFKHNIYNPLLWIQLICSKNRITKSIYKSFTLVFRSFKYRIAKSNN